MICVGWNNVIFAPSSPLSSPLFVSGHLPSDQLNEMFIVFYASFLSPVPKIRVQNNFSAFDVNM